MLDNIIQLHRQGQLDQAEAGYRKHLKTLPEDHRAQFLLAMLLDARGQRDEALGLLNSAVSLAPDQAEYLVALGQIQVTSGHFAAAQASLAAAIKLNPNAGPAYLMLARLAWREGRLDEAARQLKLALRASPEAPEALLLAGNLALERGEHEEALRLLSPLAQKYPKDPAIQASLGQAFLSGGMLAFAEKCLRNAVEMAPDAVFARVALAEALMRQDQFKEARDLLDKATRDDPDNHGARVRLGDVCRALGDFVAAAQAYAPLADALATHPEFVAAHADALAHTGRFEEARQRLDALLSVNPQAAPAWQARAQVERLAADTSALRAIGTRWCEALPQDPAALETLALLDEEARPAEAEALADQVLKAQPLAVAARLLKTRAQVRRGELDAAGAALEQSLAAASMTSVQGVLHGTLGAVCHRRGRYDQAVEHWQRVHRLSGGALPLPVLSRVEKLPAHVEAAGEAAPGELQPVFLIAPPGCGGEQAAGVLQDLGLPLLSDRFFAPLQRRHGFVEYESGAWHPDPDADQVEAFAACYRQAMARAGVDGGRRYVDWLPGFDSVWLPTLMRAFPGARLVVALRDRRDALMHWLATGSFHPTPLVNVYDSALWLSAAFDHAEHAAAAPGAVRLDIDAIVAGDALPPALLALAGCTDEPPRTHLHSAAPRAAGGGLPLDFEAGVWQHYSEPLAAPFQAVQTPAS
ncbi:MAG TPA: tetratricopeptide repeat protein [Xanthomonadaceae bacterium]|nr:tetratricopeptide repeat protein [Xanthomonadaceae bacterium]